MKKLYPLSVILLFVSVFFACLEDPDMRTNSINTETPTIGEDSVSLVKADVVHAHAKITKHNGSRTTMQGYYYAERYGTDGKKQLPVAGTTNNDATITFDTIIGNLKQETEYIISAFAINEKGENVVTIDTITTTSGLGAVATYVPDAATDSIKGQSAIVGGFIEDAGEGTISERGILYSTKLDSLRIDGSPRDSIFTKANENPFYCEIKGLEVETKYYVRAYVKNQFGIFRGKIDSLTTKNGKPAVSNPELVGEAGFTSSGLKAEVTHEGDSEVTIRGFCWNKTKDIFPTLENDTVVAGSGLGEYEAEIKNLETETTYYIRAYAKNGLGVSYSDTISITTLNPSPKVQTGLIRSESNGTISASGYVTGKGQTDLVAAGICWSTSPDPTIENDSIVSTNREGSFGSTISGLKGNTIYYFKAYAINETDISYGSEEIVHTPVIFSDEAESPQDNYTPNTLTYFTIGNQAYILGGDIGPSYTNQLWRYIYNDRSWRGQKGFTAGGRKWQTAVVLGHNVYVLGGIDANNVTSSDFYTYAGSDINDWTLIPSDGVGARHSAVGTAVGDSAFYIGGNRSNSPISEVWSYNTTTGWAQMQDLPVAQAGGIAVSVKNRIYAGLGTKDNGTINGFWSSGDYAASWQQETACPTSAGKIYAGVAINDYIYVVDGNSTIWRYDTTNKTWQQKSTLPAGNTQFHCIFVLYSYIYIGFGEESKTLIKYDPYWDN